MNIKKNKTTPTPTYLYGVFIRIFEFKEKQSGNQKYEETPRKHVGVGAVIFPLEQDRHHAQHVLLGKEGVRFR